MVVPPPLPVIAPAPFEPAPFELAEPPAVEVVTTVPSAHTWRAQAAARQRRGMLVTALSVVLPLLLIVGVRSLSGDDSIAEETVASVPGESGEDLMPDQYRGDVEPGALPGPLTTGTPTATSTAQASLEDQIAALVDLARRQGGAVVDADSEDLYQPSGEASDPAPGLPTPAPRATPPPAARTPTSRPTCTYRPTATSTPRPSGGRPAASPGACRGRRSPAATSRSGPSG